MHRRCSNAFVSLALIVQVRNRRAILLPTVVILLALLTDVGAQSKNNSDPLRPFTTCKLEGGLKVRQVDRRPKAAEKYRKVETDKGQETVSVIDGYRVMFAYKDLLYYFANVKIEQSDAQSYAQDKEVIVRSLKNLASTKQATKSIYADRIELNGFEHYGADRDVIDVGGVMGIHVLFDERRHLVITIYVLNQDNGPGNIFFKNKRRFNDINEYRVLRDDFLDGYSACLRQIAETAPE